MGNRRTTTIDSFIKLNFVICSVIHQMTEIRNSNERQFFARLRERIRDEVIPWCQKQSPDLSEPHLFFGGDSEIFPDTVNDRMFNLKVGLIAQNTRVGNILVHLARILVDDNNGYLECLRYQNDNADDASAIPLEDLLTYCEEYDSEYTELFPLSGTAVSTCWNGDKISRPCRNIEAWDCDTLLKYC